MEAAAGAIKADRTVTPDSRKELRGKFITFEGIEGTGKTTQIELLQKYLHSLGIQSVVTREPGGTRLGERLRDLLLESAVVPVSDRTELLLMFSARAQHLEEVIYPALRLGTWVLSDRFTDASYAYQGGGRGIPEAFIHQLESLVHGGFEPDLTVLLTADLKTAMRRVSKRGDKDRFESEPVEFFERVQRVYLGLVENFPQRFRVINAERRVEEVAAEIQQCIQSRFQLGGSPGAS